MKLIPTLVLILTMVFLVGCGEETAEPDVTITDLVTAVDEAIANEGLVEVEENYLKNSMQLDPMWFSEYVVKVNASGVNIDEYGIFKAENQEELADAEDAVSDYLDLRVDNWMSEYMPEEFPKLEKAVVKVEGLYVMYAVLDEETSDAAFAAFEGEFAND